MEAVLGLLMISAGVSHGLETSCDARQNISHCYGSLGGTVYLLVINATGHDQLSISTVLNGTKTEILLIKNNTLAMRDSHIKDRAHFFMNNGTFRLNNTGRKDSGEYLMERFDSNGLSLWTRGLQLFINAPVSSPQLSTECLSHGDMRVSCLSEGDGPQYSWTLDGQTLRDTGASPGNITLKKGLSGTLTCTVRNNISSVAVSKNISHCPGLIYVNCTSSNGTNVSEWVNATGNTLCVESTTEATVTEVTTSKTSTEILGMAAGSLAGVVLVMVLAVYCVQKKNKSSKTPVISLSTVKGDSQDVEYADVRILRKEMRQKEREAPVEYGQVKVAGGPQQPVEVEYGQITILDGPRRKVDTPEEDCMYASVRKCQ